MYLIFMTHSRKRKKLVNITELNLVSAAKDEHGRSAAVCNIRSESESTLDQSNNAAEKTIQDKISVRNNLYESKAIAS